MLRTVVALALAGLLLAPARASAQPTQKLYSQAKSGTITANDTSVEMLNTGGLGSLRIQTTPTSYSGTWEVQCSSAPAGETPVYDTDDEVNLSLEGASAAAVQSVTNTQGIWSASIAGCTAVRVITTAWTSGTLTVYMYATTTGGSSGSGGGGASGSVTLTDGTDTALVTAGGSLNVECTAGCSSSAGGVLSTNNSSTSNLGAGAAFTGTGEEITSYAQVQVSVFSSHASAANGLSIQQSSDNSNWDIVDTYTVSATTAIVISVPAQARYFRVVYTNGGTLTTSLRIQTIFKASGAKGSSQRPADAMTNENDFEQTITLNMGYNGTTWDRLRSVNTGFLGVTPHFAGTAASTGTGASGAQTQRVVTATDSTIGTVTSVTAIGTSVTPGTSAAHLGKAEDAIAGTGDTGVMALGVRADTAAATAANGDYVPFLMDSIGRAWISGADVEDAAATAGGPIVMIGCVRQDTAASSSGTSGDNSNCTTDASGRIYANIFGVTQAAATYLTVRLSDGSNFLTPSSDSTHDSAVGTTGPATMLEATTSLGSDTAVADGDATRFKGDINGRAINILGCNRESRIRGYLANTDGASTALTGMGAQGAGLIIEVWSFVVTNSSSTDVTVDIRDGTAGSVLTTLPAPATTDTLGGSVINLNVPITFTANTAVAMDTSAAASTVYVTAVGCVVK